MAKKHLDFSSLVQRISQIAQQLAENAVKAVNTSLTLRNWCIGAYVREYELNGNDKATYGEKLFTDPQSLRIARRGVPADVKGQKLRVRPGQIIFGKRRAYQKKVAVADFEGICSAHAMVLEEVVGKIIPGLLPEETAAYIAGNRDLKWKYGHGDNLVLYGKQPQDVFGSNTCVNIKTSEVNYV
jgi:hypothetical protein